MTTTVSSSLTTAHGTSPEHALRGMGVRASFLSRAWRTRSTTGEPVWRASCRYVSPASMLALAHLAANGWAINIDTNTEGEGLLLTFLNTTHAATAAESR